MFYKCSLNTVNFNIIKSINYTAQEKIFIDDCWDNEKKKKPNIHNGLGYALVNITENPLKITLAPIDYKSTIAAVNYNPPFRCYSRIATSIICIKDDNIYLGKRNVNVGTFAGIYNHFGGLVDYQELLSEDNFAEYLLTETLRELSEEVKLDNSPNIKKLEFFGINVTNDKYITDFFFTYNSAPISTIDSENTEIKELKLADLVNNKIDVEVSPILQEAIKALL